MRPAGGKADFIMADIAASAEAARALARGSAAAAPVMAEHGGGVIINIGFWMGSLGIPILASSTISNVAVPQLINA